jgi:hypothetical protein
VRRQLVLVFVAISVMVALAFVVPLAFLVRSTAEDRAIDAARADAAAVVPALISGATQAGIESAAGATGAGRSGRMTIMTTTGLLIGPAVAEPARLEAALTGGASAIGEVEGGVEVVTAVATAPGQLSAIRVFVPDETLHRGQTLIGIGHHRRVTHFVHHAQIGFDFRRRDIFAADFQHVFVATHEHEITIGTALGHVAGM